MGVPAGNTIGPKGKDHINTLKLDIIIINTKVREDNNPNNFDDNDENYKKIKVTKLDKYYGE